MKAMVLHETGGTLTMEETPMHQPRPGEALVRVKACGLGLTLVWNRNDRVGGINGMLPRIVGHEIAGEVVELGEGTSAFQPGDRVNVYFYLTCGDCRWCNVGREDLCDNYAGVVGSQINGGLAEYVSLPVRNLSHIPPNLDYVAAAVAADAVATPLHVLRERAKVQPPETVLVVGAGGGVGIHMVQMAKVMGTRVIAVDISEEKLALAKEMGADEIINSLDAPFEKEARRLTGGRGVDAIVELVGRPETIESSILSLDKGGRIVYVGFYDDKIEVPFRPNYLMTREITFTGSRYCSRQELAEATEMVARGQIKPVVTQTCELEESEEVLQSIQRMEMPGRACVVFK